MRKSVGSFPFISVAQNSFAYRFPLFTVFGGFFLANGVAFLSGFLSSRLLSWSAFRGLWDYWAFSTMFLFFLAGSLWIFLYSFTSGGTRLAISVFNSVMRITAYCSLSEYLFFFCSFVYFAGLYWLYWTDRWEIYYGHNIGGGYYPMLFCSFRFLRIPSSYTLSLYLFTLPSSYPPPVHLPPLLVAGF